MKFSRDSLISLCVIFLMGLAGSLAHGAYVAWTYDPDKVLKAWIDKNLLPHIAADSVLRGKVQTKEFRAQVMSDCLRLNEPPEMRFRVAESDKWSQIKIIYNDKDGNVLDTRIFECPKSE
jgi:hypothetical protein